MKHKPASLLLTSLAGHLMGCPHLFVEDRWPSFLSGEDWWQEEHPTKKTKNARESRYCWGHPLNRELRHRQHKNKNKATKKKILLLLLFTQPLLRDGGTAGDHGAPEARQLPRSWTRGRREIERRQKVSGEKSP